MWSIKGTFLKTHGRVDFFLSLSALMNDSKIVGL